MAKGSAAIIRRRRAAAKNKGKRNAAAGAAGAAAVANGAEEGGSSSTNVVQRVPIRFGDRILLSPKHLHGFATGKNFSARANQDPTQAHAPGSTKLYVEQLQSDVRQPPELRECWFTIEPKPKRTSGVAKEIPLGQSLAYGVWRLCALRVDVMLLRQVQWCSSDIPIQDCWSQSQKRQRRQTRQL